MTANFAKNLLQDARHALTHLIAYLATQDIIPLASSANLALSYRLFAPYAKTAFAETANKATI